MGWGAHLSGLGLGLGLGRFVLIANWEQRKHLNLAAFVHPKCSIMPFLQRDTIGRNNRLDNVLLVLDAPAIDNDVALKFLAFGNEPFDCENVATCLTDC